MRDRNFSTGDLKTVVQLSESFKYIISLNCLQRAETTGETLLIKDLTMSQRKFTDINWPVSYSENNNNLPYHLNNNTYFKRL